jgi:5-methylcytosine-specific restriction protein A
MPTRPPKTCCVPGCPRPAVGARCTEHAVVNTRWPNSDKLSSTARGYGAAWQRLRRFVLERDPICRVCRTNHSTEVDHLIPKSQGGTDEEHNLRGICGGCHATKTADESRAARLGRRPADATRRNVGGHAGQPASVTVHDPEGYHRTNGPPRVGG